MQFLSEYCQIFGWFSFLGTEPNFGFPHIPSDDICRSACVYACDMFEWWQVAVQPLSEVAELWDRVQAALVALKQDCGLAPISNIKQTIRALLTRTLSSTDGDEPNLRVMLKDEVNEFLSLL